MNSKEAGKHFRRLLARYSLIFCSLIIRILPRSALYGFANAIGILGYYIAVRQRKIALESLSMAFGKDLTDKERTKIAKDCFKNMAKSGVEMLYLLDAPQMCRQFVAIEGKKHLDEALSKGRGVIAVSAHFGNFPLALTRLKQEGYEVSTMLRRMRDEKLDDFLERRRRKIGINSIYTTPRQQCVEDSLRVLRNNEVLFIQLDQNFGTGGIFVEFFGRESATATGPVVFALRTEAPIIPIFIVRQAGNSHRIIIEPEIVIEEKDTQENTVQFNIQKITSIIESYVRKYPQEWGWIHRRWKSQRA